MKRILLLDTSVASDNKGDDIIMECVREELQFVLKDSFGYTLPTQVSPFHWYQVLRNSRRVKTYADCDLKFIGGSNILCKDLLTHYPQWNINWFNCRPIEGCIGVGVGAGAGNKSNWYTRRMYQRVLSHVFFHSVRDKRTKEYVESLGLKAINTGCVTMWKLTPDFCKMIPTKKSRRVVFTITATLNKNDETIRRDQFMINTLLRDYEDVYFWPQGFYDFGYFCQFGNINKIKLLTASKEAYHEFLLNNDVDYVGTRLHGGIYAMRHGRRAIIIAIDERAREINKTNHLNCIDIKDIEQLPELINSEFETRVVLDYQAIEQWKSQFENFNE